MIPGPTEIPWRVIRAMMRASEAHYDPDFNLGVLDATCGKLRTVLQTDNEVFIMPGSGRCAVESAITSVIEPGDRVLCPVFGVFSNWMKQIVERLDGEAVEFPVPWGQRLDLDKLDQMLESGGFKALNLVHNESSTGAMYPIDKVGEIAARHGVLFIVDAVSSAGAVNIETDHWHIDCLCTASQKGFCSPAGVVMVTVSQKAWQAMERRRKPSPNFSYDLLKWKRMWVAKERGGEEIFGYRRQPFTMPVHNVYALAEAVDMILEEGLEARFRRHVVAAEALRASVRALGVELFAPDEVASYTITGISNPPGVRDADLRKIMQERYGSLISGGLEAKMGKMFRIGHMGCTAAPEYVLPTILALEGALASLGWKLRRGSGVEAAEAVFAQVH